MTEERRVALVSGGNRGIGLEICRQLAAQNYTVILGSRDESQGREAAAKLEGDVRAHQLDVSDAQSIERVGRFMEEELGRLDVLVNNAGISNDSGQSAAEADLARVRETLEANFLGAWNLCEVAVPLMRKNAYGRIVNISSGLGALEDMGGGSPGYRVSKTALNALTRILATELRSDGILVNSVDPGWVQTDMGGSNASRSVEDGADTPVWAATLRKGGPTGGFFRDRRPVAW